MGVEPLGPCAEDPLVTVNALVGGFIKTGAEASGGTLLTLGDRATRRLTPATADSTFGPTIETVCFPVAIASGARSVLHVGGAFGSDERTLRNRLPRRGEQG